MNIFTVVLLSFVLIVIFIVIIFLINRPGREEDSLGGGTFERQWQQVEKYLSGITESDWRLAVIEADKFLDGVLKFKGIGGQNLGERLKVAQAKYKNLRQVWPAHILRNKLVHESDYHLSKRQAAQAVKSFQQAAKILGFKKS